MWKATLKTQKDEVNNDHTAKLLQLWYTEGAQCTHIELHPWLAGCQRR
jgi:hypothetical protein